LTKTVPGEKTLLLPDSSSALPGREQPIELINEHYVSGRPFIPPFNELGEDYQQAVFGLGCFWGAERKFWNLDGVYSTAVGYAGGLTANPSYQEVCTGGTGHTEVVLVNYREQDVSFKSMLQVFFEVHNPTQGMRQGNDIGTQYRSAIYYTSDEQRQQALEVMAQYQQQLAAANHSAITTEVEPLGEFYYAEQYHQQYLAKNPGGYCGLKGTGVSCAI